MKRLICSPLALLLVTHGASQNAVVVDIGKVTGVYFAAVTNADSAKVL